MHSILDTSHVQRKNVNYNELIEYIYKKNKSKRIVIQTESINTTKDFFYFCLDLFCKGLLYLYGDEHNRVRIDTMTLPQIQEVIDKLGYTGIMTIIHVEQSSDFMNNKEHHGYGDHFSLTHQNAVFFSSPSQFVQGSLNNIEKKPDNQDLSSYKFHLVNKDLIYIIHFEIKRM
jgi:hypothetical protein